jgi:hypothetical protein
MLRGLKVENGVETLVDEVGIKRSGLNQNQRMLTN